jgi:hypothetical protein
MKKIFIFLIASTILTACNDSNNTNDADDDSTRLPSTLSPADTSTFPVDTPARPADTTIKK